MVPDSKNANLIQCKWQALSAADRKAVLAHFDSEELDRFQGQIAELHGEVANASAYRGYSPWLGRIIESCKSKGSESRNLSLHLTEAAQAAIQTAHEAVLDSPSAGGADYSLLGRAQALFQKWVARR